uniref:UBP-type domain-containing protein n=1 Tax=Trichuris muris TaxID=70415 RepID=A0A5S6QYY4_TRIMR
MLCSHYQQYKQQMPIGTFRMSLTYRLLQLCDKSENEKFHRCKSCQQMDSEGMLCFGCPFQGCTKQGHMIQHLKNENHQFALALTSGMLYCKLCEDFKGSIND